ncbi:UNVERIFIED_CONTAM: hypothetical protein GTU68_052757, partial [Idotea baltica]|nr:hypothetical protein [Idotea baltica]
MGGTCVIRGCVPKKLMVFASEYHEAFADARAYGWDVEDGSFNWPRFQGNLHAELDRLEGVYRKLLGNSDVAIHDSRATVSGTHEVTLADGTTYSAKHILVATGGRPVLPDMKNAELGITSNEIFSLPELPKKILIVGGGYIASEFACILNGLGVDVTQFYRGDQILRGFDDEARGLVSEMMVEKGVNLRLKTNVAEMEKHESGIRVVDTDGIEAIFDQVMFATGRTPNTDGLGLEAAGVEVGRKGEVVVDDYSQTKVPSIYAV